ncbi:hypothetical protein BD289DRAFT_281569 [Coniella lustricola]|uniref:Secreted protein n=1 Tax=Coniella lustricola TaxID=2025994 RepID=A0A2T3A604_9PEZI|nr:hypothetical protein BD289DRAFT_281569 [Coniella lustricola]
MGFGSDLVTRWGSFLVRGGFDHSFLFLLFSPLSCLAEEHVGKPKLWVSWETSYRQQPSSLANRMNTTCTRPVSYDEPTIESSTEANPILKWG